MVDLRIYDFLYSKNVELYKKYKIALPRNPKGLGKGACGIVFDIGNGKALKITDDGTEAQASNIIKLKPSKYINKIYEVFKFSLPEGGGVKYGTFWCYGIIQDKLIPHKIPRKLFTDMLDLCDDTLMGIEDEDYKNDPEYTNDYEVEWLADMAVENINKPFGANLETPYKYLNAEALRTFAIFYFSASNDLEDRHIDFQDWHYKNVMLDAVGNYKLIDLGLSESPETEIDVIESWIQHMASI